METLEHLKEIVKNAPDGANYIGNNGDYIEVIGDFLRPFDEDGDYFDFVHACDVPAMRSLSDIKRIIELMELMDESEPKKEECKHPSSTASYTHVTCDSCYMIRTDGGWGCASRKWFDNIESAKFYEKNGILPR